jgi:hypothetical protein
MEESYLVVFVTGQETDHGSNCTIQRKYQDWREKEEGKEGKQESESLKYIAMSKPSQLPKVSKQTPEAYNP